MKTNESKVAVPDIEPVTIKSWTGKPINQYSLEGKFIRRFKSISEATKELSIKGGALSKCLKGQAKTCKGYQWRYSE